MHLDVLDLKAFYYRSALGRAAQRAVRERVVELWPEAKGQTVVGFGFAAPLLRPLLKDARRVIALMPGPQGVMTWPANMKNVSVLCEETRWPIKTGSVDKLLVLHGLETSDHPFDLLQECYRVLGPGGRALFVVPNRVGLWARSDQTPFGYGRPYSLGQLEALLKSHGLIPERHRGALYTPPSHKRFWLRTANFWEKAGRRIPTMVAGGVLIVEVSKQIPAPKRPGLSEAVRRPLRILEGMKVPEAKPV
ncbi:MAG TPA: methyltransferase domain-containing protein [Rhodobacteraceae bacterium]|nr:methyltransferase domain-containing protein [Paracoccaceae bacterium]